MTSFKNKIRGKKYAFKHSNSVEQLDRAGKDERKNKQNDFAADAVDWEFVNFNTGLFNNGGGKSNQKSNRRNSMVIQSPTSPLWYGGDDSGEIASTPNHLSNVKRSMSECVISPADVPCKINAPVEVKLRPKDNNAGARIRPTSWLCAMPRYFISEESLTASENERKFQTRQLFIIL